MHLLDDGVNGVRAWQMAVTIPEVQDDVAMPLFQLQEGVATSSAGLVCARMSGVKESVIHRAHEVVTAMKEGKQVRPLPEILRYELSLSDLAKTTINNFIRTDWKDASDEDVITLRESIGQM
jgi:DNA mismatch repair protein MSH5